ncbi:MAG: LptA/OstA family protein [Desulfomonilia bacterium]|jgi:lipopolysaccharide export system protein LptA|nr:LptA/OstA family protein [Deltaproteobacteria bacterium]MDX9762267.1 LptA/OstA family protein [Desulfomonilia bacterium]HPW68084.1 LptA/OstA family protein [Deltaproteobacteria bacterium]
MRTFLPIFFITSLAMGALTFAPARAEGLKGGEGVSDMITIESDHLDVNTEKGDAVFTGNVKATQGDITVQGARLILQFDETTKTVNTLVAENDVFILWQDRQATCDKAVYRLDRETLDLSGDVLITRGEERLSGQRVKVDMKTNSQTVEGQGGRVQIRVKNDQESGILQWQK